MKNKVSIAIPTYNRPGYLKQALQSILGQTFQDFSVYVFDNASEEPIEKLVEELGDPRIHFVGNDKNIGSSGNINRILNYPFESKYLVIFHDDDAMHPNMLKLETAFLDAHKNMVFVVSDLQHVSGDAIFQWKDFREENISSATYRNQCEFVCAVMRWVRYAFNSAMYRVEYLKNDRMNFERFSDFADLAFLVEVSQRGSSGFLGAPLVNYRIHPQQDSKDLKDSYRDGAIELLRFYKEIVFASGSREVQELFKKYAPNFLLRTYANINKGIGGFTQFIKKCREDNIVQYYDFRRIDTRGAVSLASIVLGNKKVIDAARWAKNLLQS